ncbi:TPA: hypothetical protein ACH1J1_003873 [Klebsiella pneumoniae]|uniref:hypothetical protein n=1 Tax=Enterobacteriaceae TaxID=543 RepID=UPI0007CBFC93|nr:hypothetical protein [Klebsiella pneumoniae]ECS6015188.1 hypothetical protein [Salmonella enterica subsp. enterica serovar Rough O:k:1,5]EDX2367934.1 hypothetical protein [Salmonella enterica subsp. enterica serovar Memphis]EED8906688.1 hypothetical protein [Salmonella enterica subsp. enterica]EKZ9849632.1 hypothetical protein [Klebsiella aerogenes]ELO9003545.1 hypothetical protein [Salmonella enterica]
MTQKITVSVASYVQQLANDNNVTANRDGMSRVAVAITALADDSVELDNVEQLLVNLKKKGVLSKSEILQLQGRYFREQKHFHKKATA